MRGDKARFFSAFCPSSALHPLESLNPLHYFSSSAFAGLFRSALGNRRGNSRREVRFLASFALECRNRFKDRHVIISSTTPQGTQEMKGVLTDAGSDFIEMDLDVLVNPENVWLIKLDKSA